jgi:hypothetical protein
MKVMVKGQGSVELTRRHFLASGGQGSVYARGKRAFKVYSDPADMIPVGKMRELAAIADPAVIKPEALLLDSRRGAAIGYTMRLVPTAQPLCQLIPRSFRDRHGLDGARMLDLVQALQRRIESVHRAGVLVVDLSEMNFVVDRPMREVFAIDVDSYQTEHYPATAITPAIQDPFTPFDQLNTGSDWFSFAVVSFQLFCGIHPYKGRHPSVSGLVERMQARLSVLDPAVRIPKAALPASVIPDNYLAWYRAVLDRGERRPPPGGAVPTVAPLPSRPRLASSAALEIELLLEAGEPLRHVVAHQGALAVAGERTLWLDGRRVGDAPYPIVALGISPLRGKPLAVLRDDDGRLRLWDATGGVMLALELDADAVAAADGGRLLLKHDDKVVELLVREVGSSLLTTTRLAARVMPRATQLFEGMAVQNLLGACYLSLFSEDGAHHQLRLAELDGYRFVDAKHQRGVVVAYARKGRRLDRVVLRFRREDGRYDLSIRRSVDHSAVSFAALDSGVCAMVAMGDDEQLELFSTSVGSAAHKALEDDALSGDMLLAADGNRLLVVRGSRLARLRMLQDPAATAAPTGKSKHARPRRTA